MTNGTTSSVENHAAGDDQDAQIAHIEKTRQALAEHRALPLGRRVVRRLTLRYPAPVDRWQLAQHDMEPFDKLKRKIRLKVYNSGSLGDEPPFVKDPDSAYHDMLRASASLSISRYVSLRCNPVVRKFIATRDEFRADDRRIDDPWYAGLYRQEMPKDGRRGSRQTALGIFLTDRAGVRFEALAIDEAAIEALEPETRQELVTFVSDLPERACCTDPRLTARAPY
jgi:hypothetical protein